MFIAELAIYSRTDQSTAGSGRYTLRNMSGSFSICMLHLYKALFTPKKYAHCFARLRRAHNRKGDIS